MSLTTKIFIALAILLYVVANAYAVKIAFVFMNAPSTFLLFCGIFIIALVIIVFLTYFRKQINKLIEGKQK